MNLHATAIVTAVVSARAAIAVATVAVGRFLLLCVPHRESGLKHHGMFRPVTPS